MKRMRALDLNRIDLSLLSRDFGQEVYRWVDEQGTVHFTDDLGQVPEKYRDKSKRKSLLKNLLSLNPFLLNPLLLNPLLLNPSHHRQGWGLRRDLGQPLDRKIS